MERKLAKPIIVVPAKEPKELAKKPVLKAMLKTALPQVCTDSEEEDDSVLSEELESPRRVEEREESEDCDEDEFWEIVERFDDRKNIPTNVIAGLSQQARKNFKKTYAKYYEQTRAILEADGMFVRNDVTDHARVISHAIGVGREQYETLITDMQIYQFFIVGNECESLDDRLPADMQMRFGANKK